MTTVISVENLSKTYHLGQIGTGTFTNDLKLWWAKTRGKPNPLLRIGEKDHGNRNGEELWALRDVSFTVQQGEVLGIIGKNGAGKSTLLKILSRVTAPTSGRIKVKGRIASLLEVGTGFHPELTGRENIYLNGAILGMSRRETERKFDEIVDFSEVEKFIDTPVKRYSSGMYVRLAFAVAAYLDPEILVVDEVLAVGDASFQKKCLGKMGEVAEGGRTVLFVSHNMSAINRLCQTCLWIESGKLRNYGDTSKVIASYLRSDIVKDTGEKTFPEISGKKVQLRQLRLLNNKKVVSHNFSCDDPITIEMLLQVNSRVRGLYCWLDITREDGTLVFMSDSFDTQPNPLHDLSSGSYKINVGIPRRSLAHGEYSINLIFAEPGVSTPVDSLSLGCNFSLDDFTTKRGNKRPGFFSAIPLWDVEQTTKQ